MENFQPSVTILGVRVHACTLNDALMLAERSLKNAKRLFIVTVNPEFIMEAKRNEHFRRVLNGASLAVPDGFGLRLFCRLFGKRLPERVTGADLTEQLAKLAERHGRTIFLFGAKQGRAQNAAEVLQKKFPKLRIAGAENDYAPDGHFRTEKEIVDGINAAAPDILLVALGAPQQELWLARHLPLLPHVRIAMGVGGTFDYLAGDLRRAPKLFRTLGLEWLWRLILQPKRWRRIVTATIRFPFAVLTTPNAITSPPPP